MTQFDLPATIGRLLASCVEASEVFPRLHEEMERYHGREVASLAALRARDNMKLKGDLWEEFCRQYLLQLESGGARRYETVWAWREVPGEVLDRQGLKRTRVDNGIDLVALRTDGGYDAVQCKYLGNGERRVSWALLATFVGLSRASGPWTKCVVMTTGKGITWKVPRTERDLSYCRETFRNIPRTTWLRMSGGYVEHRLGAASAAAVASGEETGQQELDVEALRRLRLERFGGLAGGDVPKTN